MRQIFLLQQRCLVCLAALTTATVGQAAPQWLTEVDQHGDFVLFGNTLGWDCSVTPVATYVVTGTVNCAGATNTSDSGVDLYWRSEDPNATSATASTAVSMANARSTAMLVLPAGAVVTYARLYWAAYRPSGGSVDNAVTIDRPGDINVLNVTADATWRSYVTGTTGEFWYQGAANVTDWVSAMGAGAFRLSGVSSLANLNSYNDENPMAGWAVVAFYRLDTDPPRNLTLFEGLDTINPTTTQTAVIDGFLVPGAGYDAKLGVIAYEGDDSAVGDALRFGPDAANLVTLSNAFNPADNFFNSTHSYLGVGVSNVGDLPRLTGAARSMGGVDLDVVNVTAQMQPNQTAATIQASSTSERIALGALVTSISTFKPNFASSGKSVTDVNGGTFVPGDVIEYEIVTTNTGSDVSDGTVLVDALPAHITYVAGSLAFVNPVPGAISDASGDDLGEYNPTTRTITVRLGTGATATLGGQMAINDSVTLRFQVTLDGDASGTIENQAIISAEGVQGAPATDYPTDGNGTGSGSPPTAIDVDRDGDGISDPDEVLFGTDPDDPDSDDDGVIDGSEPSPSTDTDGDGLINALDPDSDNDGLFDGTELGLGCGNAATNPAALRCVPDADAGATKTNPLLADTDSGGASDGSEDANLNGRLDAGETNPIAGQGADDSTVVDSDGDGLSDGLEATLGSDPNDRDSDDDGVLDGAEPNPSDDGDYDGLVDVIDADSDNDGLFDGTEMGLDCSDADTDSAAEQCTPDADPATHTSAVSSDTDRGSVRDGSEDDNLNGRLDSGETDPVAGHGADDLTVVDTDGDGLSDRLEATLGSDPNDADTDDDGARDGEEANLGADTDRDGRINVLDEDSDADGLFDGTELGQPCTTARGTAADSVTCTADGDAGQTRTSPVVADTDHGGVADGTEDTNRNGVVDTNERNPNNRVDDSYACFIDSDCDLSLTSGRVCSASHSCINGCRGTGGNGCPIGQICSSTTTAIGTCSVPSGAGGAAGIAGSAGTAGVAVANGGAVAAGGTLASGGVAGGGGTVATGGVPAAAGGVVTAGAAGAAASPGAAGTVALAGQAGSVAAGGVIAAAGTSAGGQAAGSAGVATGTGGALAAGGEAAGGAVAMGGNLGEAGGAEFGGSTSGGAPNKGGNSTVNDLGTLEGGGCDCAVAGQTRGSSAWLLMLGAALLWNRRRRSR